MRYLNEQLVDIYKLRIYEAISREMMPEPAAEPMAPDGIIGSAIEAGGKIARETLARGGDILQYMRKGAAGIPIWLKLLYRAGKFTYQDLKRLFRDIATGELWILDESGNMRKLIEDPNSPNGWNYDPNVPPVPPGPGKKPWNRLQQYQVRQGDESSWGGWGRIDMETDPAGFWNTNTIGGIALGLGAGYLMLQNPDSGFNDADGDGIPDTIDNDGYVY